MPATVTASVAAAPMREASKIFPRRSLYMYKPTNNAMGIVQAIVKVPQELPGTACLMPEGRTSLSPEVSKGCALVEEVSGDLARVILKDSLRMMGAVSAYWIWVPGGTVA